MSLMELLLKILDTLAKLVGLIVGADKLYEIWKRATDDKDRRDKG